MHYFSKFLLHERIVIDDKETFRRQSYRNRCEIAGSNGKLSLIIPVVHRGAHLPIREVKIDNAKDWQRIHWQSIRSAYGKAPFFEHYAEALQPFFHRDYEHLFDFNRTLLEVLLRFINLPQKLVLGSECGIEEMDHLAEWIDPKKDHRTDTSFFPKRYMQVFEERLGFLPNLSIIDVLFNLGPEAADYVEGCVVNP